MPNEVLAHPPGDHCFTGVKHSGDPTGHTELIADVETYIAKLQGQAEPAAAGYKKIIFFFADVYGPLFINNKLIQDYFASQGFLVLGPDYFEGDPVYIHSNEPNFDRTAWMDKSKKKARELIPKWTEAVKTKYGTSETKYVAVGYCFGAPFVMEHGANDLIVAGAIAHPAFLNEDHFRNIKVPLFLSCAEIDHTFGLESRRRAEDILVGKKDVYHFQVFSGIAHGFAVRGNPEVENERWAKEESARGIITWFERFAK